MHPALLLLTPLSTSRLQNNKLPIQSNIIMAGDNDAAGGGGAAEVDVESNRRDNLNLPRNGRTSIKRIALSGVLSTEEKLEAIKRKYDENGDGTFQEEEVDHIITDLFSEVQSSDDLKQKNSYLGKKLSKNRKYSLAAIVVMGIVTIAASASGLVAVNKSVHSSEEKVEGAIVESAFAETQVDDVGVAHLTDKAGRDLTTRATGDVFQATLVRDPRTGRKLTCVRVLEMAGMAGSVASGADTRLAVVDESSGLEKEVLSLAGDFKDSGDILHFGDEKAQVHLDDDSCNIALHGNAMGIKASALLLEDDGDAIEEAAREFALQTSAQGEVEDEALPFEDRVDGAPDETSPGDEEVRNVTLQANALGEVKDEVLPLEDGADGAVDETNPVDNSDGAVDYSNVALQGNALDKFEEGDLPLEDGANGAADETGRVNNASATDDDGNTGPFSRLRSLIASSSAAAIPRISKSLKDASAQSEGKDVLALNRMVYVAGRAALSHTGSPAVEAGQSLRKLQDQTDTYVSVCSGGGSCNSDVELVPNPGAEENIQGDATWRNNGFALDRELCMMRNMSSTHCLYSYGRTQVYHGPRIYLPASDMVSLQTYHVSCRFRSVADTSFISMNLSRSMGG
ncbi:hypothetical protein ACHAWF_017644 [Thalassiosira exigua]